MDGILEELPKLAAEKREENIKFFKRLKKRVPKNLDYTMQELHEEEFERTDCLTCGNCCKTTSPLFIRKDIERSIKIQILKGLAQDFGDIKKHHADEVLIAHTTSCLLYTSPSPRD